jgi:hypothetical protein
MVWYKSCPRCEVGDMVPDQEGDRLCLQCGYMDYSATPFLVDLGHISSADKAAVEAAVAELVAAV